MLKKIIIFHFIIWINANLIFAEEEILPILSGIGGEFSAINHDGKNIKFSSFKGKVTIMSFGYTNCADICPFTLGYLKKLYNKLSLSEQQKVNIIFITIDPQYDTPKHLKEFIGHFNEKFIGLSGSKKQIDYIVSLFQASYHKLSDANVPTKYVRRINHKKNITNTQDTTSLYNHTIAIYLIDKDGNTRSLEYTGTPIHQFVNKIRSLINE